MDQFKFSLGPFEIFSAIGGGVPLFVAGFLLYNPVNSLRELVGVIQKNASLTTAIAIIFVSYILSGVIQVLSWRYFKLLCQLFKQKYSYFSKIFEENPLPSRRFRPIDPALLSFEGRLVVLLRTKLDIKGFRHMSDRVKAYLREHGKQSVLDQVELYLATHIMYRNWSVGFSVMSIVLLINLFRAAGYTLELLLLPVFSFAFGYATFRQALNFKRWENRELLLGFYFAAIELES